MVIRRDRFERVYALTEAVAPAVGPARGRRGRGRRRAARARPSPPAGLTRLNGIKSAYVYGHKASAAELAELAQSLADGRLADRGPGRGLAGDPGRARRRRGASWQSSRRAGCPPTGRRSRRRPTRRRRSSRRSIRSARAAGPSRCSASTTSWEVYKPADQRTVRLLHDADPVGRPAGRAVRSEAGPGDRHARDPRPVAGGRRRSRGTRAFAEALVLGMARFVRFLGAGRLDATAVPQPALRRRLAAASPRRRR